MASFSKNQKDILIKCLKYTPTPERNIIELRNVVEFTRKFRLMEIFFSDEKEIENEAGICQSKNLLSSTSKQKRLSGQNN